MDASNIVTLIANFGFPIVMCIFFFFYIREQSAQHKEETEKMAQAIQNNTLTMQKLIDKLDKE